MEKLYECRKCKRTFARAKNRDKHEKRCGVKPKRKQQRRKAAKAAVPEAPPTQMMSFEEQIEMIKTMRDVIHPQASPDLVTVIRTLIDAKVIAPPGHRPHGGYANCPSSTGGEHCVHAGGDCCWCGQNPAEEAEKEEEEETPAEV